MFDIDDIEFIIVTQRSIICSICARVMGAPEVAEAAGGGVGGDGWANAGPAGSASKARPITAPPIAAFARWVITVVRPDLWSMTSPAQPRRCGRPNATPLILGTDSTSVNGIDRGGRAIRSTRRKPPPVSGSVAPRIPFSGDRSRESRQQLAAAHLILLLIDLAAGKALVQDRERLVFALTKLGPKRTKPLDDKGDDPADDQEPGHEHREHHHKHHSPPPEHQRIGTRPESKRRRHKPRPSKSHPGRR